MSDETAVPDVQHEIVNGVLTEVPVAPAAAPATSGSTKLRRIRRTTDTQGPDTFQGTVDSDGETVNVDWMDDAEMAEYRSALGELQTAQTKVGDLQKADGVSLDELLAAADEVSAKNRAITDRFYLKNVKGFDGMQATDEEKLQLFFPERTAILDLIVQKGHGGRQAVNF